MTQNILLTLLLCSASTCWTLKWSVAVDETSLNSVMKQSVSFRKRFEVFVSLHVPTKSLWENGIYQAFVGGVQCGRAWDMCGMCVWVCVSSGVTAAARSVISLCVYGCLLSQGLAGPRLWLWHAAGQRSRRSRAHRLTWTLWCKRYTPCIPPHTHHTQHHTHTPPCTHYAHTHISHTHTTATTDMVTHLRGPSPWPVTPLHPPLFHLSHCALIPLLHSLSSEVSASLSTPLLCSPLSSPCPALCLHHWVRCEEQLENWTYSVMWLYIKDNRNGEIPIIMTLHIRALTWHCSLTLSWQ